MERISDRTSSPNLLRQHQILSTKLCGKKLFFLANIFQRESSLDSRRHHHLDNIDQRITADVELLCDSYGLIIAPLIVSPFTIAYYSYDAYSRAGWIAPVGMFAFFIVSTVINKFLISDLVSLVAEHEKREGDFRIKHARIRAAAEEMAFSGPSFVEKAKTGRKLDALIAVKRSLASKQVSLNLATNLFQYFGSIMSFLVIAVPIFGGWYDDLSAADLSQLISETSFVSINLIFQFSRLVQMSGSVSSMAGVTHRIAELIECLQLMKTEEALKVHHRPTFKAAAVAFQVDNLTIKPPDDSARVLVRNLSLNIRLGENLLVTGPSSAGKSSFLRVLRGLWPPTSGKILSSYPLRACFLPQRTFLTSGSILDQICYPLRPPRHHATQDHLSILTWIKEFG